MSAAPETRYARSRDGSIGYQVAGSGPPSEFAFGERAVSLDALEQSWGTAATLDVLAPSADGDKRFRRWYARYERLSLGPRMVRAVMANRPLSGIRTFLDLPMVLGRHSLRR